jgi:hypothetical protein
MLQCSCCCCQLQWRRCSCWLQQWCCSDNTCTESLHASSSGKEDKTQTLGITRLVGHVTQLQPLQVPVHHDKAQGYGLCGNRVDMPRFETKAGLTGHTAPQNIKLLETRAGLRGLPD